MSSESTYECDRCGESFPSAAAKGGHMVKHEQYVPPIEKLLAIRSLADQLGKTPTQAEMDEHGAVTHYTIIEEFGSWNEGVRAAGLAPNSRHRISDDELVAEIQRLARQLDRTPTQAEMDEHGDYSVDAVARAFGSWTDGVRAAGFRPVSETRSNASRVSKREIIRELRSLATRLGRAPCARETNERASFGAAVVRQRFESFEAAVRQAGLEPYQPKEANSYTKSEVIDAIQRLADELGESPTNDEMAARGDCSPETARRLFGSWNDALRAAGLPPRLRSEIPTDELLAAIDDLADQLGRVPRWADNRREGEFSVTTYRNRFGSWKRALAAAGYDAPPTRRRRWANTTDGEISYGSNWPQQRRRALERDEYECQAEGCEMTDSMHIDRYGQSLEVHHLNPLRMFREDGEVNHEEANRLENLITLCRHHHAQWEYDQSIC